MATALLAQLQPLAAADEGPATWRPGPHLVDRLQAAVTAAGGAAGLDYRNAMLATRYMLSASAVRCAWRLHRRDRANFVLMCPPPLFAMPPTVVQVGPGLGALLQVLGPDVARRRLERWQTAQL